MEPKIGGAHSQTLPLFPAAAAWMLRSRKITVSLLQQSNKNAKPFSGFP
jgi:hypothetical protein